MIILSHIKHVLQSVDGYLPVLRTLRVELVESTPQALTSFNNPDHPRHAGPLSEALLAWVAACGGGGDDDDDDDDDDGDDGEDDGDADICYGYYLLSLL